MHDSPSIIKTQLSQQDTSELISQLSDPHSAPLLNIHIDTEGDVTFKITKAHGNTLDLEPVKPLGATAFQQVSISFIHSWTQFETQGYLHCSDESRFQLELNKAFYRIQRRDNFRTRIPEFWNTVIEVHTGSPQKLEGTVGDISLKGCFFVLNQPTQDLAINSEFDAEIKIQDFDPVTVRGVVRRQSGANGYACEFLTVREGGSAVLNGITLKAARLNRD